MARVDDPASLDRALDGAAAAINCAGPFLDTALPVVEAALRAKISYLDVTAEQPFEGAEPNTVWEFPAPFGDREVTLLPLSETITARM